MNCIYSYKNDILTVNVDGVHLENNDNIIIYLLKDKVKIKNIYSKENTININVGSLKGELIDLKVYIFVNGVSSLLLNKNNLLFVDVDVVFYRCIISGDYYSLMENGYKCRSDAKSVDVKGLINWRNKDRNTEFNINAWRFIQPIWCEFFKAFNYRVFLEVYDKIIQYYDFIYTVSGHKKFLWYDMSCAIRSIHLSLFKEVYLQLSSKIKERIEFDKINEMMDLHVDKLLDPEFLSSGNHGLWQIISIKYLAFVSDNRKVELNNYGNIAFSNLFDELVNKDGFSSENSPDYHKYICDLLSTIPLKAFPDFNSKISSVVRSKERALQPFTDYSGKLFPIGDSEGVGYLLSDRYYKENEIKLYLDDSNYFVYRDKVNSSFFCMHATNKTIIHKHADNLSFIYGVDGKLIFTDAGKYTYNYGSMRDYFTSDRAHNVLCLTDVVFHPKNIVNEKVDFNVEETSENIFKCYGTSELIIDGKSFLWNRVVSFTKIHELLVVDKVVNNDFDSVPFLNFIFADAIDLKLNIDNSVSIFHSNRFILNMFFENSLVEIKISQCWVSTEYQEKQLNMNLQVIFPSDCNELTWGIR